MCIVASLCQINICINNLRRISNERSFLKNAPYAKDPGFREQIAMVTKQLEFFEMIQRMADRKRFVPALVQVNAGKASAAAMAMAKTILESQ